VPGLVHERLGDVVRRDRPALPVADPHRVRDGMVVELDRAAVVEELVAEHPERVGEPGLGERVRRAVRDGVEREQRADGVLERGRDVVDLGGARRRGRVARGGPEDLAAGLVEPGRLDGVGVGRRGVAAVRGHQVGPHDRPTLEQPGAVEVGRLTAEETVHLSEPLLGRGEVAVEGGPVDEVFDAPLHGGGPAAVGHGRHGHARHRARLPGSRRRLGHPTSSTGLNWAPERADRSGSPRHGTGCRALSQHSV
jgi:hypothetical protein